METSEHPYPKDNRLRLVAATYFVVILAAFAIGLYGVFSLVSFANAEIEQSVHLLSSLQ